MNEMADTLNYTKSNEMADTLNDHDTKTNPYLSSKLSFGGKEPEQAWNLQSNQMQFSQIVFPFISLRVLFLVLKKFFGVHLCFKNLLRQLGIILIGVCCDEQNSFDSL